MATFPDADLPTVIEARFSGETWTDLSSRLLDYPIAISAGRSPGAQRAEPSQCSLTLDNDDAALTPLNPMSTYYPYVKLGVPMRLRLRWIGDTFARTLTDSWGSTPEGYAYTNTGGAAGDYDTTGTTGTHLLTSANVTRASTVTPTYATPDVTATVSVSATATGASLTTRVIAGSDTSNQYAAWLIFTTGGNVQLQLTKTVGGSQTTLVAAATVGTYSAGTQWSLRVQRLGGSIVRAKAWQGALAIEPDAWDATAEDAALTSFPIAGALSRRETGNTNTNPVVTWYDLQVNDDRAFGFADSWQPDFVPTTEGDVASIVRITASGISRRLTQGSKPLRSAMYRTMVGVAPNDYTPHAYWPMEDGTDATRFASALPDGQPLLIGPGISPASDDGLPGSESLPTLSATSIIPFAIPAYANAGQCVIQFLGKIGAEPAAETTLAEFYAASGPIRTWRLTVAPGSPANIWMYQFDSAGAAVNSPLGAPMTGTNNDNPAESAVFGHHVMFTFAPLQDGADVESWFGICSGPPGEGVIGANIDVGTLGLITGGRLYGAAFTSVGHLGVYTDGNFSIGFAGDSSNNIDAMQGYAGETVDDRVARLGREESIGITIVGTSTHQMGVQQPDTVMNLFGECEDVDQGVLGDSELSLGFTCGSARYNLPATMTVDLSTYRTHKGTSRRVLSPTYDDQGMATDVTAERPDGGSATVTTATTKSDLSYTAEVSPNVYSDDQLPGIASAYGYRRSQDVMRFPNTPVDLFATPSLIPAWQKATRMPSVARMVRTNLPGGHFFNDIDELLDGYTETLGRRSWTATYQGSSAQAYEAFTIEDQVRGRIQPSGATLSSSATTTATSLSVAKTGALFITSAARPGDFPFYIDIGGEKIQVTAISGGSSPQTFTVVRSINGVVKSHSSGAVVTLWRPAAIAL